MIGASKILTVSYGTFSCTLEGFDDPFNTMRAIAEYFRDLAAEDRYFGAEPPTPDAAMLHKIAEREIHRRVEAKIQENGVILRTGDAMSPRLDAPRPVDTTPAASNVGTAPTRRQAPAAIAPGASAPLQPTAPAVAEAVPEGVAAKLLRVRNAVAAQLQPTPVRAEDDLGYDEDFGYTEMDAALPVAADQSRETEADSAPFFSQSVPSDPLPQDREAEVATQGGPQAETALADPFVGQDTPLTEPTVAAPVAETPAVEAVTAPSPSVEAPLLDAAADAATAVESPALDAFVGAQEAPEPVAVAFVIDAPAGSQADDDALLASLALQDVPYPAEVHAPVAEADALADDADDDLSGFLADLADAPLADLSAADLPEVAEAPEADLDDFDDLPELDDLDDMAAAPVADQRAPHGADNNGTDSFPDLAAAPTAAVAAELPVPAVAVVPAAPVAEETDASDLEPVLSEKAQRARARVIKIRRADPAPQTGSPAVSKPDAPQPEAPLPAAEASTLSPEAEADLARELRALEADDDRRPAAHADAVSPASPAAPLAADAEPRKQLETAAGEESVDRLIAQTNTELAGPENRRRLSAIAHLKAAVAATVADRRAGAAPAPTEASRIDPYRHDLAQVVRPRRPGGPPMAAGERPAPLVLVSEQRIDRPAPPAAPVGPVMPVRPRRVTSGLAAIHAVNDDQDADDLDADEMEDYDANIFTDARGFAEFADRLGATELPDLLEAAAAYTACIEGRPHFSRPQLLQLVSASSTGALNREDGLRSFGRLMRMGRITKLKRGQFVLTERSHLLAEARKLGS